MRLGDAGDVNALAGDEDQLVEAELGGQHADGLHPGGAAAGGIGNPRRPADTTEVAVVPCDVAVDQLENVRVRAQWWRLGHDSLDDPRIDDLSPEEVGVEIGRREAVAALQVGSCRAEVQRALGVDGDVVVRHDADVVLGERVAEAESQPAEGAGRDVGDAVLGALDGRGHRRTR